MDKPRPTFPQVDLRRQRELTRDKFVPIHCQDEAIGSGDKTYAAHDEDLKPMRIDSPLSSRLCQPPDLSEALGPRASPSVSLPVSRSIPGFRKLARSITILTIEAKLVRRG